jgi:peroxiredoxin
MSIEIIYLTYQNQKLKDMLDDPANYFKTLQTNQTVPSIRGQDINGVDFHIKYDSTAPYTLLLWFSSSCSSCQENFGFWNSLYQARVDSALRFLGFCAGTIDEARQIAGDHNVAFPIMAISDLSMIETFGGNILPQTIIISPQGKIYKVWPGALDEKSKQDIKIVLSSLSTITIGGGD